MIHHLATALVDFLVALFALSSKNSQASRPMALVAFSMGLWSLELFILSSVVNPLYLDTLFHLTRWGMFLIPPSLVLLTWSLIGRRSEQFLYGAVLPGFIFSIGLCLANFFFMRSNLEQVTGGYQPEPDAVYSLFSLSFVASLITCIGLGIKRYKRATYREIQQIKWLLIVLGVTLVLGVLSMLLIHYPYYLKLVGASINMVFIGLLFYATVQHHLMDVKLAFSVGLVKASAIAAILWSYFFIGNLIESPIDPVSHIVIMAICVYLALEIYPVYQEWALSKTKKMVSRSVYDVKKLKQHVRLMLDASFNRETFDQVLHYLFIESMGVTSYCLFSVDIETKALKLESMLGNKKFRTYGSDFEAELLRICDVSKNVVLTDECHGLIREVIEGSGFNAFIPIENDEELIAVLFLGKSVSSEYYHYDDMIMIDWLMRELGPNIERLYKLEEVYDDLRDAKKTLSLLGMMNQYHHDIKAPLSIIDGVMSNNVYEADKQRDIVLQQVSRMTKLVATMSSVFREQRERREKPVEIVELVKDCVVMFEKQIDSVDYDISDLPPVTGDEDDLKILFINIIKNAIEATNCSSVVILIKSWMEAEYTCVSIKDNGVGMTEERIRNLFRRSHSTKPNGSGVGMQAIKRIADEHQATVDIHSAIDKGSTFIIKFPSVETRTSQLTHPVA